VTYPSSLDQTLASFASSVTRSADSELFLRIPAGGSVELPSVDSVAKKLHYLVQDGLTVFGPRSFCSMSMARANWSITTKSSSPNPVFRPETHGSSESRGNPYMCRAGELGGGAACRARGDWLQSAPTLKCRRE